jgi:Na+-driven multidrug efflux pump
MSLLGAVFRGAGDMKTPALTMFVGAAVQIPLSGALILGWVGAPRLGIAGGAISVIAVASLNCVVLLARLAGRHSPLALRRDALRFEAVLFADILRVGALASLSPVFVVLTVGILNSVMASFGTAAVAGYGIGARLEFLLIPLVFGLGVSMTALVGVNTGAGNFKRAKRIGWTGGAAAALLTGIVGVVLTIAPGLWMNLFTDNPATYAAGATYLQIAGPAFLFQGLGLSLYFASQGAGTVLWPVIATILRFVLAGGAAVIDVRVLDMGLDYVCACIAAGMVLYGIITAASLHYGAWRRAP